MKKTYQNPTMEVVKIQTAQMLAASAKMFGQDATGEALSREFSLFEDGEY